MPGTFVLVEYPQNSKVFYVGQVKSIQNDGTIKVNLMKRIFTSREVNYIFIWPEIENKGIIGWSRC